MFENIIGHEKEKQVLENFCIHENLSHAYLFSGKKGIGKAKMAFEFAKTILGTDSLGSCPDFKYISKKEEKKEIIIEQIRKELIDDVYTSPVSSNRKVYIIDDAELLNVAAQNALLKTLEEPPSYVIIILISCNTNHFLTTILSRVHEINFQGIPDKDIRQYAIEKYQIHLEDPICKFIGGSIGFVINMIENHRLEKFFLVDELYAALLKRNIVECFKQVNNIDFAEKDMLEYLEFLFYQDGRFNTIQVIEKAKNRMKMNGNYDIVIDNMLLRIVDEI